MGVRDEQIVREFLACGEGRQQHVDGLVSRMTEDIVWQVNVPTWRPRIGREACRTELARQNSLSTGGLPGSELRTIASTDSVVFTERRAVAEMGDKQIMQHINAVFEVNDGKIAAWREYYDSADLARQLGVDVRHVVEQ
jgi:limonene-1,2-epoxide hydrolase